jgi:hypothetical protein
MSLVNIVMNILCLGCSFTADMIMNGNKDHRDSWPRQLAKLMPEHTIINAAMGATSVAHSMWVMELFNQSGMQLDKIIFQVTNSGRLTFYNDLVRNLNIIDFLQKETDNYMTFKLPIEKVLPINMGLINHTNSKLKLNKRLVDFAEQFYSVVDDYHFDLERRVQVEFISNRADIVFYHVTSNTDSRMCIQDILGNTQFNNYVMDNGMHFGPEGIAWQASFIEKLINQ